MTRKWHDDTKMIREGHPDEPECPSNEKIKTMIIIT